MACGEFPLTTRYFDRAKNACPDTETGIGDDCALLNISEERTLTTSTDTLMVGNHFLSNVDPASLAYKALAVSLSDLAAMDAGPAWLTLALTLPEVDKTWLEVFGDSLFIQLDCYDMQLISGDTTRGPLSMTPDIHGFVPPGRAMKYVGTKPGDWIYVIGAPGNSAAGLAMPQNRLTMDEPSDADYLLARHLRPTPRVLQGQTLRDLATSATDLSSGLVSGLGHTLKASGYGAHISLDAMPYSDAILRQVEPEQALRWVLAGGEDYGLCFTIPELSRGALDVAPGHLDARFTYIGQIAPESGGLQFVRDGRPVTLGSKGYDHFAQSRRGAMPPEHA